MTDFPEDLLSDFLQTLQMRAAVFANPTLCGNWQVNSMHQPGPSFHLVAHGGGWLHLATGAPAVPIHSGDLLVFPRGAWHMLAAGSELGDGESGAETANAEGTTGLVCGNLTFVAQSQNPILDALPDVLVLSTSEGAGAADVGPLARLLAVEAMQDSQGRRAVLDRLAEILFINVLRHVIREPAKVTGVLAALADARIGRALAAFHRAPGKQWQLDELAALAGMSRSSFASHFQRLVKMSPMQYLAHWRMLCAEIQLTTTRRSVAQIADTLGYETEAAFRHAYKRHRGVAPGAARRAGKNAHSEKIA